MRRKCPYCDRDLCDWCIGHEERYGEAVYCGGHHTVESAKEWGDYLGWYARTTDMLAWARTLLRVGYRDHYYHWAISPGGRTGSAEDKARREEFHEALKRLDPRTEAEMVVYGFPGSRRMREIYNQYAGVDDQDCRIVSTYIYDYLPYLWAGHKGWDTWRRDIY